jgi:aldehyde:ferredoxin oxidoreductase
MQNMEILTFERASEVIRSVIGINMTPKEVRLVGTRIVNIERAFNVREGCNRLDDSLPQRFLIEQLPDGPSSGTVVNLDKNLDDYYTERCWNISTGTPTSSTLRELGLSNVERDMRKRGLFNEEVKE